MKLRNAIRRFGPTVGLAGGALLPVASFAATGTYDAITDAIDWSDVVTGVAAVAALVAAVLVVKRGSRMLLSMIGS